MFTPTVYFSQATANITNWDYYLNIGTSLNNYFWRAITFTTIGSVIYGPIANTSASFVGHAAPIYVASATIFGGTALVVASLSGTGLNVPVTA